MQRSDKALGDKDFSRAYENYQSQSQGRNSGPSPDAANAFKNPKYSEISFYKNIEQNGYKNVDDFVANKGTASGFDRKDYAAKKKDFDNLYSSYEKNTSQPLSREEFAGRLSDRIQTDGLRDGSLRKDDLKSNNQYFEVERDSVKMNAESLKKNPNYRYFPADEPEQLKELKRKDPDLKYTPGIERAPAADKPKEAKTSAADAPDANTLNAERIQNAIKALGGNKSTAQANVNIQDGSTVQPPIVDRSASINRGGPAGVQV